MIVGSIVKPIDQRNVLHCGSGTYPYAICVSLNPFILISEEGDMRWSATVKAENYEEIGVASKAQMKVCFDRLKHDQKEGTL